MRFAKGNKVKLHTGPSYKLYVVVDPSFSTKRILLIEEKHYWKRTGQYNSRLVTSHLKKDVWHVDESAPMREYIKELIAV